MFQPSSPDGFFANGVLWTDIEIVPVQFGFGLSYKSPNRAWLLAPRGERPRTTLLGWPGTLPGPFRQHAAIAHARFLRCRRLKLTCAMESITVQEWVLELLLLGWPVSLIIKLLYSLAPSPALCATRGPLLGLLRHPMSWHDKGKGRGRWQQGGGGYQQGGYSNGWSSSDQAPAWRSSSGAVPAPMWSRQIPSLLTTAVYLPFQIQ